MSATLRPATAADHSAVAGLLNRAGLPLAGVSADLAGFVVAERDGRIVGTAAVEVYGATGLLRSVAVEPEFRSGGLGRAVVERALEAAERAGVADVFLLTTTAERYFPRFGFTAVPRDDAPEALEASAEFRGACPASAVLMHRRLTHPYRVLVLCTGNSARSQIAEALLARKGGDRLHVASAGVRPAPRVHPLAVAVLREHGIEWSERSPTGIDAVTDRAWDVVITVCDHAREACPVLPGSPRSVHWSLSDPARAEGDAEERRRAFLDTYTLLDRLTDRFVGELDRRSGRDGVSVR
ncbi:MAG TPA: arsenic resistance N-acetyltransferase ArsN2 [Gemmatimonadales bacterium]|nr:arsenic resistance N-acetyltransferase ArsN2 [Gemmatimonadales bacterium]